MDFGLLLPFAFLPAALYMWFHLYRVSKALAVAVEAMYWIDNDKIRERAFERVKAALGDA